MDESLGAGHARGCLQSAVLSFSTHGRLHRKTHRYNIFLDYCAQRPLCRQGNILQQFPALTQTSHRSHRTSTKRLSLHAMLSCANRKLHRKLIPLLTFKQPATCFWVFAAPLLEEKSHLRTRALVANIDNPALIHRPRTGTTLAANNHPRYALQIQFPDGFD